jgi:hypothetical protein
MRTSNRSNARRYSNPINTSLMVLNTSGPNFCWRSPTDEPVRYRLLNQGYNDGRVRRCDFRGRSRAARLGSSHAPKQALLVRVGSAARREPGRGRSPLEFAHSIPRKFALLLARPQRARACKAPVSSCLQGPSELGSSGIELPMLDSADECSPYTKHHNPAVPQKGSRRGYVSQGAGEYYSCFSKAK